MKNNYTNSGTCIIGLFEAMTGVKGARNTKSLVPELTQGRNFNWLYSHFKKKKLARAIVIFPEAILK